MKGAMLDHWQSDFIWLSLNYREHGGIFIIWRYMAQEHDCGLRRTAVMMRWVLATNGRGTPLQCVVHWGSSMLEKFVFRL